jgi:sarcosine oxidase, subunit delta
MLLITCPTCGERPELEFRNMGEAHIARPAFAETITDDDWNGFLYLRSNTRGLILERWRHIHGCARFFNAVRHTVTDQFVKTYEVGAPKPDLDSLAAEIAEREAAALQTRSSTQ